MSLLFLFRALLAPLRFLPMAAFPLPPEGLQCNECFQFFIFRHDFLLSKRLTEPGELFIRKPQTVVDRPECSQRHHVRVVDVALQRPELDPGLIGQGLYGRFCLHTLSFDQLCSVHLLLPPVFTQASRSQGYRPLLCQSDNMQYGISPFPYDRGCIPCRLPSCGY